MEEGSSILLDIGLIFVLILLNAFFAASEIAIISLNRNKINLMANEGDKKAGQLLKLIQEPGRFLATIQVGITLAGFLASASAAVSISKVLAALLKSLNIPFITHISDQIALIFVTILLAFITLVLGELVPKRLALYNAERIAMIAVKPILILSNFTVLFVKILTFFTNMILKLFGVDVEDTEEKVTEEEIRLMIHVGEENGVLNETEKEMIDGIFDFDNTLAREVMTPRTNVFAVDISMPTDELIDAILEEKYSRIPVYENEIDNIIGILYMKDLFPHIRKWDEDVSIRDLLRPAYFVPDSKNIDHLFRELQQSQNHMAILIDEYGGFTGILTIEDLIEEIVGNISDEYDEERDLQTIEKIDHHTYRVNGLVSIDEVNEELELKLPKGNFDTIGGFVIGLLGSIPQEDEEHTVEYENLVFKIEKVEEKRIDLLKIYVQE